jgi:3-methyladenine DNA glycosylase AlkC
MPFQLITPRHLGAIDDLATQIPLPPVSEISTRLAGLVEQIHSDIPEKRRISTGRYSIVKALGAELFPRLDDPLRFGVELFENKDGPFVSSTALQILSLWALEKQGLMKVQPYFEAAAADQNWILRECASGLVRKLIKAYPDQAREWYLVLVHSQDPNQRRFVSESLRPVVENRWFHKEPEYALEIIKHLFQESAPYPRTSVGNSLSDWMRVDLKTTWPIVQDLAQNGDSNSYWIAYRACRNLVKKQPLKVLDLLGVDEYKYKNRVHRREEVQDRY